jgi:2-polyprenyl-6-methoxyphenol hydroxylase-like FAD-dependent oxidoreductase
MAESNQALVIGGSIGGLLAAALLRRAGWRVTVFERSREGLASRGAGLGITSELAATMHRAGARFNASLAVAINASVWLDREGCIVHEQERHTSSSTWSRIYLPLRATIPDDCYRAGMTLERVEQDGKGVTACFTDGTRVMADLLVAADGNQSTVRRQLMPEVTPRYAGYVAWRGLMEERDIPPGLHREFFDKLTFSFPEGEMALAMPVPGPGDDMRPGHRRYYFIWYRPTKAAALEDLGTDANGVSHGTAIPPPLIRREFLREIKARAQALFAPDLAAVIDRTAQPLLQPIFDLEAPRLVVGRVVLLGDAGFAARPHVAAGTTKAALDALCLAEALGSAGSMAEALARYERVQHEFGCRLVAHARYLGAYLEGQLKPLAERQGDALHRDPRRLMRDYGAPHLVHALDVRELAAMAGSS